jgi:hypothetical protein
MPNPLNTPCAVRRSGCRWNDAQGFTLVETIVAATILFTCIAAAAFSYNTAIRLTGRLNATISSAAALSDIQKEIKPHLFNGEKSGRGELADGAGYFWQAVRQRSSPTILRQDDEFSGGPLYGRFQVELVAVALTITQQMENRNIEFPFEYKELIWKRNQR